MKFVFFGTPSVASETLQRLISAGFIPSLVVTNPDKPAGRGLVLTPSPTRVVAKENNIPTITPTKLDDATIEEITRVGGGYAICVAYGRIIPQKLIALFPQGIINIHYSLLPLYRGATPLEATLLHGDTVTGITIQKMAYELDAGDIIAQEQISIHDTETAPELRQRLITLGADTLLATLPRYLAGDIIPEPQDSRNATYCGKFNKTDGELFLDQHAHEENWRKYRAFADTIGTYFFVHKNGKKIRIKITAATYDNSIFTPRYVVPEGKKNMLWKDYEQSLTQHTTHTANLHHPRF